MRYFSLNESLNSTMKSSWTRVHLTYGHFVHVMHLMTSVMFRQQASYEANRCLSKYVFSRNGFEIEFNALTSRVLNWYSRKIKWKSTVITKWISFRDCLILHHHFTTRNHFCLNFFPFYFNSKDKGYYRCPINSKS